MIKFSFLNIAAVQKHSTIPKREPNRDVFLEICYHFSPSPIKMAAFIFKYLGKAYFLRYFREA